MLLQRTFADVYADGLGRFGYALPCVGICACEMFENSKLLLHSVRPSVAERHYSDDMKTLRTSASWPSRPRTLQ